jgi:hypothetical protein
MVSYHLSRAASYTVLGAVLGGMGGAAASFFSAGLARLMPIILALLFLAMAFGFDRNLPQPKILAKLTALLRMQPGGAAWLGLVTPLIPCGPLYLMFGVSLISGSWMRGGTLMLCFALGTMPLYLLAQWQWFYLCARMSLPMLRKTQKVLACASAGLVIWRGIANGGLGLGAPICH